MNLTEKLALMERVAREAGTRLLTRRDFRVERKAEHDYVTEVDRQTEEYIRAQLLGACPKDGFLGEEYGEVGGGDGCFIVDPIDGTTNFIRDLPVYAVSIGYRVGSELMLGCVFCPVLNEMFLAQKGKGATLNGRPIRISDVSDPKDAIVSISFSLRNHQDNRRIMPIISSLHDVNDMRRMGSGAYDLCLLACGRLDGFIELGLNIYDIAAGIVVLREAGGFVTGWPGEADCTVTGNVLAGNGAIHAFLGDRIGKFGQSNSN